MKPRLREYIGNRRSYKKALIEQEYRLQDQKVKDFDDIETFDQLKIQFEKMRKNPAKYDYYLIDSTQMLRMINPKFNKEQIINYKLYVYHDYPGEIIVKKLISFCEIYDLMCIRFVSVPFRKSIPIKKYPQVILDLYENGELNKYFEIKEWGLIV